MRCNEKIKFAALLERALALGFDAVVTGHTPASSPPKTGNRELHRAADWAKDQSYVLGVLTHEQLKHAWFPLADTPPRHRYGAEAAERGFSVGEEAGLLRHLLIPKATPATRLASHIR